MLDSLLSEGEGGFYCVFYVVGLAFYGYLVGLSGAGSLDYRLFLNICHIFGFFSAAGSGGFMTLFERSDETYKLYSLNGYGFGRFYYLAYGA